MPGEQTPFWQMSPLQHVPQMFGPHAAFSARQAGVPPSQPEVDVTTV
jgi:hypothetical protein